MILRKVYFYILGIVCLATSLNAQYTIELSLVSQATILNEGCPDQLMFVITPAAEEDLSFDVRIAGIAEKGVDYNVSLGESITFQKGESNIGVNIFPLDDNKTEVPENISITISGEALESDYSWETFIHDDASIKILGVGDTVLACRDIPLDVSVEGEAGEYKWFPADLVSDSLGDSTQLLPTEDGWFKVEGKYGSCSVYDSVYVDLVDPQVDISTTAPKAYCNKGILAINATTNFPAHFSWNYPELLDDSTSLNPQANITESTLFIGSLSFYNCTISDSLFIRIDSLPDDGLKALPPLPIDCTRYCEGDVIKITDKNLVREELYPFLEYQWEKNASIINGIDTTGAILVELDTNRTYYRTSTNGTCTRIDTIDIGVIDTDIKIFPQDTTVCWKMPVQVHVKPEEGLDDIEWQPTEGLSCTDCLDPVITPTKTQTYNFKAVKYGCCPVKASIRIVVNIPPIPIDPVITCPGVPVQINVNEEELGLSDPEWINGNKLSCTDCFDPMANPNSPRSYTLQAFDEEGCLNMGSVNVSFYDSIDATLNVEPGLTVSIGATVTVTIKTKEPLENTDYNWLYNGDPTTQSDSVATFTIINKGTENVITVIYVDNNGCTRQKTVVITGQEPEVEMPNAFTPDGDGNNDFFRPLFKRSPVSPDLIKEFVIVNRFGHVVYNNDNPEGWDGRIRGTRKAPPDVYLYRVKLVLPDGAIFKAKGDVTLIR